jgi:hypothetical protein
MGLVRTTTLGLMGGLLWALAGCSGTPEVQPDDAPSGTGALQDEDAPPLAAVGAPQVDLAEDAPEGVSENGPTGETVGVRSTGETVGVRSTGETGTVPEGGACASAGDCASGVCEGKGCDGTGPVCVAKARMCTKDLRAYCGCDGRTFRTSGSCAGRPYAARGACPSAAEDAP